MTVAVLALRQLRDAPWMTGARMRGYCRILAALVALFALGWIGLSHGGVDLSGKPLGTDFVSFWTAARMALAGHPASAYDAAQHWAAEAAAFPGTTVGYYAFFYPPLFLLICLPLGLLPYGAALCAWLAVTGAGFVRVVTAYGPRDAGLMPLLAFPAVLITLGHGQNAFLSAALMGGAVLALPRRPVLAGVLFGLLAFKPHLGLLVPLFLLAGGCWAAILAAAATVVAFAAVSLLAFGPGTWAAFLAGAPLARAALEQGLVGPEKMVSTFAALQLWGAAPLAGYMAQGIVAVGAAATLVVLCRRWPGSAAAGPALVAASLLASPFLLDYDLALLAIPLAFLFARGRADGFLPWEKTVLFAAYVLPMLSRTAGAMDIPLSPPVIAALLVVLVRRAAADAALRRSPSSAG